MTKKSIIALMFVAGTAMAGTTSKEVIPPPPPAPEPSLWQWFAGGSVGYLFDYEEEMYHLHVGVDTPWNWGGLAFRLLPGSRLHRERGVGRDHRPHWSADRGVHHDLELGILHGSGHAQLQTGAGDRP